jgi:hypothetical protein
LRADPELWSEDELSLCPCLWQNRKKDYLDQSIEKLEKAISLNDDSRTHEGELAHFALGNAL